MWMYDPTAPSSRSGQLLCAVASPSSAAQSTAFSRFATGFLQAPFAVHHPRAGLLAQFLHHRRTWISPISLRLRLSSAGVRPPRRHHPQLRLADHLDLRVRLARNDRRRREARRVPCPDRPAAACRGRSRWRSLENPRPLRPPPPAPLPRRAPGTAPPSIAASPILLQNSRMERIVVVVPRDHVIDASGSQFVSTARRWDADRIALCTAMCSFWGRSRTGSPAASTILLVPARFFLSLSIRSGGWLLPSWAASRRCRRRPLLRVFRRSMPL